MHRAELTSAASQSPTLLSGNIHQDQPRRKDKPPSLGVLPAIISQWKSARTSLSSGACRGRETRSPGVREPAADPRVVGRKPAPGAARQPPFRPALPAKPARCNCRWPTRYGCVEFISFNVHDRVAGGVPVIIWRNRSRSCGSRSMPSRSMSAYSASAHSLW